MRTPTAAGHVAASPSITILLCVGALLLALPTPVLADPARVPSVDWLALSRVAFPAAPAGDLVPTLGAAPETGPRLTVTQKAIRGTALARLPGEAGQDQMSPKQQRSWFGRNWKWFVPVMAGVAFGVACAVGCFPAGG